MSGAINKRFEDTDSKFELEYVEGEYKQVFKPYRCSIEGCFMRFAVSEKLSVHLKEHRNNLDRGVDMRFIDP